MKDKLTQHYTINQQTHYTIQFRRGGYVWVADIGKIKYYLTMEEALTAIKEAFRDEHNFGHVDEATVIEWKKTPIAVKKNNKQSIESTACCYDVEYQYETCPDNLRPLWKVRRSNLETVEEARQYIKDLHALIPEETFRIVKREMTSKYSVVE